MANDEKQSARGGASRRDVYSPPVGNDSHRLVDARRKIKQLSEEQRQQSDSLAQQERKAEEQKEEEGDSYIPDETSLPIDSAGLLKNPEDDNGPTRSTDPAVAPLSMNCVLSPGAVAVQPPWKVEEQSESLTVEGDGSVNDNPFVTANVVTQDELERELAIMVKERGVIAQVVEPESSAHWVASMRKTVIYAIFAIVIIVFLAVGLSFGLNAKMGVRLNESTPSPTSIVSYSPTVAIPYTSFSSLDDLYGAVDEYMIAGNASLAAERYGYPMGTWDVSYLSDFSRLFDPERPNEIIRKSALRPSASTFNEDIGGWDMSNAETLHGMFWGANAFDRDLSRWNVSKVRDFAFMFHSAYSFRGQGLEAWNTRNARTMRSMFMGADSLQMEDLTGWAVSNVNDFADLFGRSSFVGNISAWDVSSGANFEFMFRETAFNGDLSLWNVERAVDLSGMFDSATEFEGIGLDNWNPRFANSMAYMFWGCTSFMQNLCNWSIPHRANVDEMFLKTACPNPSPPNLTAVPVSPLCFSCV